MATFSRSEGPQAWILPYPDGGDATEPVRVFEPCGRRSAGLQLVSRQPPCRAGIGFDGVNTKGRLWLADTDSETAHPLTAGG